MLIVDFEQVEALIPENGSLALVFSKTKKGEIIVAFAPKYPNKDTKQELRPMTLQGTPKELNEAWVSHILEIAQLENVVATADIVTARKAELTKAVTKSSGAKPAVTTKSAPAAAKSTTAPEKANPDGLLFETSAPPLTGENNSSVEEDNPGDTDGPKEEVIEDEYEEPVCA